MNSFFIFPLLILCSCKSATFFCSTYLFLDSVLFFLSIFTLVYYIISLVRFNFSQMVDKYFYYLGFFVVFVSLYFCFSSCTSLIFLFWLEMCVFSMIFLIFSFSKEVDKVSSTLFMFLLNILGSIPFMGFCYFFNYSLENLHWSVFFCGNCLSWSTMVFLMLILLIKLPILIGHFWLTKAHVAASGPLSMILASLMLKLGSMGMMKFNYFILFSSLKFMSFLMSISLFSCLFFTILMVFFFDLKFLVACSSILHMSLIVPLVLSNSGVGCFSGLFMTVGHGFTSLILFFLLTLIYEFSMSRSSDLGKCQESHSKFYAKWIFFFSFLNLGVPPFLGFFSELYLFSFLTSSSYLCSFLFALVMLFSLFFTILLILKILFGKKNHLSELSEFTHFSAYLKICATVLLFYPALVY